MLDLGPAKIEAARPETVVSDSRPWNLLRTVGLGRGQNKRHYVLFSPPSFSDDAPRKVAVRVDQDRLSPVPLFCRGDLSVGMVRDLDSDDTFPCIWMQQGGIVCRETRERMPKYSMLSLLGLTGNRASSGIACSVAYTSSGGKLQYIAVAGIKHRYKRDSAKSCPEAVVWELNPLLTQFEEYCLQVFVPENLQHLWVLDAATEVLLGRDGRIAAIKGLGRVRDHEFAPWRRDGFVLRFTR